VKTILCYGDSNTFGYIPGGTGGRYDHKTRWPGALREHLNKDSAPGKPDWWIVEEGLNGRTICRDDPFEPGRNGLTHIIPILKSHKPLDIVVVMLGTNDTKRRFTPSPYDIAEGLELIIRAIQHSETGPDDGTPQVLVVSPPHIEPGHGGFWGDIFDGAVEVSEKLAPCFRKIARRTGAEFFDAAKIIRPSPVDGVHLDPAGHRELGSALAGIIPRLLSAK